MSEDKYLTDMRREMTETFNKIVARQGLHCPHCCTKMFCPECWEISQNQREKPKCVDCGRELDQGVQR